MQPAMIMAPPVPAPTLDWLCVDLETANGRPEDAERHIQAVWRPDARWKEETIGQRYQQALAKKQEQLALLDASPIIVIGLRSNLGMAILHCCQAEAPRTIEGAHVQGYATEAEMLVAFRDFLDANLAPDSPLVGHNILDFDLPRLRFRMMRHGIRLPAALVHREHPVFDTMREFVKRYTISSQIMIGLDEVLQSLGLPSHKSLVEASQIPELFKAGEYDTIIKYTLLDVLGEGDLFLRMSGQSEGLK